MAGGIDLYAGRQPIAGINLFKADKNPLNQIDMGIEDVIGEQGFSAGGQVNEFIHSLVTAILGLGSGLGETAEDIWEGSWDYVNQFFGDIETFLNVPGNYLGTPDFDLRKALAFFVTENLHPTHLLAPISQDPNAPSVVQGFVPMANLAIGLIADAVGGAQEVIDAIMKGLGFPPGSATADQVDEVFTNIYAFLGNPDLANALMNPVQAVTDFITEMLHPRNMLGPMDPATGLLFGQNIPLLDATKVPFGVFPQNQVAGLEDALEDIYEQLLESIFGPDTPLNANNLFNQVPSRLMGLIPYSHIGNANPNLITLPGFDISSSVTPAPGWTWDAVDGHTTPGCAVATATGGAMVLVSNVVQATPDQKMTASAWVKMTGVAAPANSNSVLVTLSGYLGSALVGKSTVASVASPAGTTGWVQITGPITVPAGVDNFVLNLELTAAVTAGTVKWDDIDCHKTGLMAGDWMKGISGTVTSDLQSTVDQIWQAIRGGTGIGNPLDSIKGNLLNIPGPNIISTITDAIVPFLDASKIATGLFQQNRILGLPTDLSNKALRSVVNSKAASAANLVVDPGFDNPDVWVFEPGTQSTEQSITSGTSRKQIADGTLKSISLTATGGPGTGPIWMVRAGAQYYLEASVFPKATNVGGGTIGVLCSVWDSTGVNTFTYVMQPFYGPPPTKGQWTTYSGYFNIPAGYDGMIPYCLVNSDVPVNDAFYWDRIVCKEVTRLGNSPDLQALTDNITQYVFGGNPISTFIDDARNALNTHWNTTQSTASTVQSLVQAAQGAATSGASVIAKFDQFPDSTQMPNPADPNKPALGGWVTTYSGAGGSSLGVQNGKTHWYLNNNGSRVGVTHHPEASNTDFQAIGCTVSIGPDSGAESWILGRVNAANDTYVFVRVYPSGFLAWSGELGCMVANVKTTWASKSLPLAADSRFLCGVGANPRAYQFFVGSTQVHNYSEVGTVSALGPNNRFFGIRGQTNGSAKPSDATVLSMADNALPTNVGSTARIARQTTANWTLNRNVLNILGANFWNSIQRQTADWAIDLGTGRIYAAMEGLYLVTFRHLNKGQVTNNWTPVVAVNGTVVADGTVPYYSAGDNAGQSAIANLWQVYLNEGDYVQVGMDLSGNSSIVNTNWPAGGNNTTDCYLEIGLLNKSLA